MKRMRRDGFSLIGLVADAISLGPGGMIPEAAVSQTDVITSPPARVAMEQAAARRSVPWAVCYDLTNKARRERIQ